MKLMILDDRSEICSQFRLLLCAEVWFTILPLESKPREFFYLLLVFHKM